MIGIALSEHITRLLDFMALKKQKKTQIPKTPIIPLIQFMELNEFFNTAFIN